MNRRPTKAVVPVAGYGTRRLPITKTIEKCMLPLLNRPIVDYIVEHCAEAGITDVLFVVDDSATQIKNYFGANTELESYLAQKNKTEMLKLVQNTNKGVNVSFASQSRDKYGTAVPVNCAKDFVGQDESFVVLMGDDLVVESNGQGIITAFIDSWLNSGMEHAIVGVAMNNPDVTKYGFFEIAPDGSMIQIVERPTGDPPSNQINVSKYIFNSSVFKYLEKYVSVPKEGEYLITDIINECISNGEKFMIYKTDGKYLDGGSLDGWIHANNYLFDLQNK